MTSSLAMTWTPIAFSVVEPDDSARAMTPDCVTRRYDFGLADLKSDVAAGLRRRLARTATPQQDDAPATAADHTAEPEPPRVIAARALLTRLTAPDTLDPVEPVDAVDPVGTVDPIDLLDDLPALPDDSDAGQAELPLDVPGGDSGRDQVAKSTVYGTAAAGDNGRDAPPPARPANPIPSPAVIAAVRLAYALADAGLGADDLTAPGAVTVVTLGAVAGDDTTDGVWESGLKRAIEAAVSPAEVTHVASDRLRWRRPTGRALALLYADPKTSVATRKALSEACRATLLAGAAILALAPETAALPEIVQRAATTLRLPPLDPAGLALVIEAVAGEAPAVLPDADLVATLSLDDLTIALMGGRSPAEVTTRLVDLVARRRVAAVPQPPRLEDLAGYGEAKAIGLAIAADLQAYRAGRLPWSAIDPGLLLVGPPGTGKSMFAQSLARSAGVPLIAGSLGQWQAARDGHLGHTLSAMRASFAAAQAQAPSILLIDEIDSFGDREKFTHDHRDYSIQVVNALLELLDGVGGRPGVVVIGATNHVGRIDPAIRRSGRLDRTITIGLPGHADRTSILRHHLQGHLADADLAEVAAAAAGLTPADLGACVRRARAVARRAERAPCLDDLLAAVVDGRPAVPPALRRRIAIHEAGHAIVSLALGERVTSLAVTPTGGLMQTDDRPLDGTLTSIERLMTIGMAGRAAERLVLGSISAGAGGGPTSDLARATLQAVAIEGSLGLGRDLLWLGPPEAGLSILERLAPAARAAVRHNLVRADARADAILVRHREALIRLGEALVSRYYLDEADVREIVGEELQRQPDDQPADRPSGEQCDGRFGDGAP